MVISNKIKGVFRVSSANIFALFASLITSFILPLAISVEQYGYWQLYSLYLAYIGFFVIGFNDGIHLNYSSCEYDNCFQRKFKSFFIYLAIITSVEILLMLSIIRIFMVNGTMSYYLSIIVTLNLLPTALDGLFLYMNQGTLRFKQYSMLSIIDKAIFLVMLLIMFSLKVDKAIYYILVYTSVRYLSLLYVYISSKEVFKSTALPFAEIWPDIKTNYRKGAPLMIASIIGGSSMIVCGRLFVKYKFGIITFSSYSFALNTIVIATQFITAIATVFYPILKRCSKESLPKMYSSFDKVTTIFSALLLFSYFPAAFLVSEIYVKYSDVLSYMYIVYPLFIYQCKSNVLIVNSYKVNNSPGTLLLVNLIGIIINIVVILLCYRISPNIETVAIATLISLALWYYAIQLHIHRLHGWYFVRWKFYDIALIIVFIIINYIMTISFENVTLRLFISFIVYTFLVIIVYYFNRRQINTAIKEFQMLMKD